MRTVEPSTYMTIRDVMAYFGAGRTWVARRTVDANFPKPVRFGPGVSAVRRWRRSVIEAWAAAREAAGGVINPVDAQAMRIARAAERRAKLVAKDCNQHIPRSKLSLNFGRTFISQTNSAYRRVTQAESEQRVTRAQIDQCKAAKHAERLVLYGVSSAKIDEDQLPMREVGDARAFSPSLTPFIDPSLSDDCVLQFGDTLAVEEARIYDPAFDPDF